MADKNVVIERTYPHPHDPSVVVVDTLGADGRVVATRNRLQDDRNDWYGTLRKVRFMTDERKTDDRS